jgi:hypothetical protein
VIDFNALATRTKQLEAFFEGSKDNVGVLTDMMGIECLKRDGVDNHRKSFEVLSRYSHRVIVLQSFSALRRMRPMRRGFAEAVVDRELTVTFPAYCRSLFRDDNQQLQAFTREQQAKVQVFMGKIQVLVDQQLRQNIAEYEARFSTKRVAQWKESASPSADELSAVKDMVAGVTTGHFRLAYPNDPLPDAEDAPYWVPFRHTVALQALTMKWIKAGGYQTAKAEILRNDSVDIFYVTYGTIFDGVLSEDRKLQELSGYARDFLKQAYGVGAG